MESEHSQSGVRNPPHQWGLFPPFGFFNRGNSTSEGAACRKHNLSTRRQFIHGSLSSVSIYSVFLGVERGPSAILGHRNVLYSAICSSNCRVRGIFYIFCIEAQQLQLAWHAVGVFKGGVAAKRVSKNNLPPRATHTRAPTHGHTQTRAGFTCTDDHTFTIAYVRFCHVKIDDVNDILRAPGRNTALSNLLPALLPLISASLISLI